MALTTGRLASVLEPGVKASSARSHREVPVLYSNVFAGLRPVLSRWARFKLWLVSWAG